MTTALTLPTVGLCNSFCPPTQFMSCLLINSLRNSSTSPRGPSSTSSARPSGTISWSGTRRWHGSFGAEGHYTRTYVYLCVFAQTSNANKRKILKRKASNIMEYLGEPLSRIQDTTPESNSFLYNYAFTHYFHLSNLPSMLFYSC